MIVILSRLWIHKLLELWPQLYHKNGAIVKFRARSESCNKCDYMLYFVTFYDGSCGDVTIEFGDGFNFSNFL